MDGAYTVADSHEWEELCKELLALRHADDLQLIDASRAGDFGLEAFTRDTALGFQCYAPLEPLSAKERYEKHRDKLTSDLKKLETNASKLLVILGPTKLTRYVFMVPQFDVVLLEHCGAKRDEFREKALAILADDFDVVVHTEANYPLERAQLVELALAPLNLDIPDVDEVTREQWAQANVPLVDALTTKVAKLKLPELQGEALREEFLQHYLRREQIMQRIFNDAPDTHVRLESRIRQRERLLATARLMSGDPPLEHARAVIRDLASELLAEAKALQPAGADAIAYGTAADWMVRCPLDFNDGN